MKTGNILYLQFLSVIIEFVLIKAGFAYRGFPDVLSAVLLVRFSWKLGAFPHALYGQAVSTEATSNNTHTLTVHAP